MNNNPKVSVVLPVYNAASYLETCLDSLCEQSLADIEIICVNDGSTDGSDSILKRYKERDPRFLLLDQENKGGGAARNTGMAAARGEYVIFLDSDDFFDTELLGKSCAAGDEHEADVVLFDGKRYDEKQKQVIENSRFLRTDLLPEQKVFSWRDISENIFRVITPAPWLKLYRRSFLLESGLRYQEIASSNDYYFGLCALALAGRICAVPEPLVYYRVNNADSTQGRKNKSIGCVFEAIDGVYDELNRRGLYEALRGSYTAAILSTILFNLKTVTQDSPRYEILEYVRSDRFQRQDVLGHAPEWYVNPLTASYASILSSAAAQYEQTSKQAPGPAEIVCRGRTETPAVVSVVIPVYNTGSYLHDTIRSVTEQTLREIEILCVDDGSSDDSLEILKTWAEKDPRITVLHQENAGLSHTRNVGTEHARGTYVYYMDSDDILDVHALECLARRAEQEALDVVYFDGNSFFEDAEMEKAYPNYATYYNRSHAYEGVFSGAELFSQMKQNGEYLSSACLQFVRRSFLREHGIAFIEGILHEDNSFSFRVILNAERAGYINQKFFHRRVRADSIMTSSVSFRNCYGYFVSYVDMLQQFFEAQGRMDAVCCTVATQQLRNILRHAQTSYMNMPGEQWGSEYGLGKDYSMFVMFVRDWCEKTIEIRKLQEDKKKLNRRVNQYKRSVSVRDRKLQRVKKNHKALKESLPYRIGKGVTWPVRWVSTLFGRD